MGNNALVVVDGEKPKEMLSFPPVAVLITGWLGPETEASIAATELHTASLLLLIAIPPPTESSGGPFGQPNTGATPWQLERLLLVITEMLCVIL